MKHTWRTAILDSKSGSNKKQLVGDKEESSQHHVIAHPLGKLINSCQVVDLHFPAMFTILSLVLKTTQSPPRIKSCVQEQRHLHGVKAEENLFNLLIGKDPVLLLAPDPATAQGML